MLRSMYSGISAMKSNQTKMDVVGNNVANVGTTAYKKTSTRFADALYQSSIYPSAPTATSGGVNPGQVGIGVKVSGILKNMVQGSLQTTGRDTDLAIDGDGFFTVEIGPNQKGYTRDGSFSLDMNGNLVTSQGYKVLGEGDNPILIPEEVENAKLQVHKCEIKKELDIEAQYSDYIKWLYDSNRDKGIHSGFMNVDKYLGNFQKGRLVTVFARSGVGKSTFALQIANNMVDSGVKVFYGSSEMTRRQVFNKMAASNLSISSKAIDDDSIINESKNSIKSFIEKLINNKYR